MSGIGFLLFRCGRTRENGKQEAAQTDQQEAPHGQTQEVASDSQVAQKMVMLISPFMEKKEA